MKVNIYEEELTERIEIRKKESGDRPQCRVKAYIAAGQHENAGGSRVL